MFRFLIIVSQIVRIRYKYRKQFSILRDVFKLHRNIMRVSAGLSWDDNDPFSKLTIIAIVKNCHKLSSILVLCKSGLAKDALPLLRTIFEELVDLKLIYENKGSAEDYFDYDTYNKLKLVREIKDKPYVKEELKEILMGRAATLEEEWDRLKNKFEIKKGDKVSTYRRWNGKDLRVTCRLVGLEDMYVYLYKYLCIFTHSTAMSAENYMLGMDPKKNEVVFEVGYSEKFIDEVAITASHVALYFLKIASEKYKLNLEKKLDGIEKNIMKRQKRV